MQLANTIRNLVTYCTLILLLGIVFLAPVWADDYTKEDLQGRSFAGQDISKSSFVKTNLRGGDFSNVSGVGTSLFGANLSNANLSNANLTGATLDMANLTGADLRGAVLENSLMWLAKVGDTQIEGADFTNALIRQDALKILCGRASGVNPKTGRSTRETLECS